MGREQRTHCGCQSHAQNIALTILGLLGAVVGLSAAAWGLQLKQASQLPAGVPAIALVPPEVVERQQAPITIPLPKDIRQYVVLATPGPILQGLER